MRFTGIAIPRGRGHLERLRAVPGGRGDLEHAASAQGRGAGASDQQPADLHHRHRATSPDGRGRPPSWTGCRRSGRRSGRRALDQRTPNLAAHRPADRRAGELGQGHALVIIITGTGHRVGGSPTTASQPGRRSSTSSRARRRRRPHDHARRPVTTTSADRYDDDQHAPRARRRRPRRPRARRRPARRRPVA